MVTTVNNNTVEKENYNPSVVQVASAMHSNVTSNLNLREPNPNLKFLKIFSMIENNYYTGVKNI